MSAKDYIEEEGGKKEKYLGEPRCIFFSDKGRPIRRKGRRDEPIEKKDHCEGKDNEKKRKREKCVLPFHRNV